MGASESNHWPKDIRLDFVLSYLSKETKMLHLLLLLLPIALTQVEKLVERLKPYMTYFENEISFSLQGQYENA